MLTATRNAYARELFARLIGKATKARDPNGATRTRQPKHNGRDYTPALAKRRETCEPRIPSSDERILATTLKIIQIDFANCGA